MELLLNWLASLVNSRRWIQAEGGVDIAKWTIAIAWRGPCWQILLLVVALALPRLSGAQEIDAESGLVGGQASIVDIILDNGAELRLRPDQVKALELIRLDLERAIVQLAAERQSLQIELRRREIEAVDTTPSEADLQRLAALEVQIRLAAMAAATAAKANLSPEQREVLPSVAGTGALAAARTAGAGGSLQTRIDEALARRLKDTKVVEVEIAEAIADRMLGWTKLLAYFIGIPLAVLAAVLGFFGIRSYNDFKQTVDTARDEVTKKIEVAKKEAEGLDTIATELNAKFTGLQDKLAQLSVLARDVEELSSKVERIEEEISFAPSKALSPSLQRRLEESLSKFRGYIAKLGYEPKVDKIEVFVDPELDDNAFYDGANNRIVMAKSLATDTDVIYREYTHHALMSFVSDVDRPEYQDARYREEKFGIESGLADYFPCSYNDNPRFAERSAPHFRRLFGKARFPHPYVRNLDNERRFTEIADREFIPQDAGEIWGGAFWKIRALIGQDKADRLLFSAWTGLTHGRNDKAAVERYAWRIVEGVSEIDKGRFADRVRKILIDRGLKFDSPMRQR